MFLNFGGHDSATDRLRDASALRGERGQDHPLAPRPIGHNPLVGEPDDGKPPSDKLGIASTIVFECLPIAVKFPAVNFDDNPGAHQAEVDSTDQRNLYLLSVGNSQQVKPLAYKRLTAGIAAIAAAFSRSVSTAESPCRNARFGGSRSRRIRGQALAERWGSWPG